MLFRRRSRRMFGRRRRRPIAPALIAVALLAGAGVFYAQSQSDATPALSTTQPAERPDFDAMTTLRLPAADTVEAPRAPVAAEPALEVKPAVAPDLPAVWTAGTSQNFVGKLQPNESVYLALQRLQVPHASIHAAVTAIGKHFDFRKARPGDEWEAHVDAQGVVTTLRYQPGPEDIYISTYTNGAHVAKKVDVSTDVVEEKLQGTIESSLWGAFDKAGASPNLSQTFIDTFMYTLDFNEDTQTGDTFSAVYEAVYLDGKKLRDGRLIAAMYQGQAGRFYAFAHTDADGRVAYYDAEGDSLKRQFLKSPLPVTRVTSKYGRRFHPVLKKMKMHSGVDYAAPVGTTVFAAADGVVTFAGYKGANGNLVSIKHSGGYVTHYAHLSKIASGIKVGKKVQQRDIIAKSGNTGRSTGPHLHYGMTKGGAPVNPLTVDFTRGEPLKGKERDAFRARVAGLMKQLQ